MPFGVDNGSWYWIWVVLSMSHFVCTFLLLPILFASSCFFFRQRSESFLGFPTSLITLMTFSQCLWTCFSVPVYLTERWLLPGLVPVILDVLTKRLWLLESGQDGHQLLDRKRKLMFPIWFALSRNRWKTNESCSNPRWLVAGLTSDPLGMLFPHRSCPSLKVVCHGLLRWSSMSPF